MARREPLWTPGNYYIPPGMATTAASPTLNRLRLVPHDIPRPMRFDRLSSEVTTLGAGATLRWVAYADNGRSYPGALVLDTGAIGDASSIGSKEATVDLTLGARRYWLGCLVQGFDASLRMFGSSSARGVGAPLANIGGGIALGYFTSGVTGAAPLVFPTVAASTSQAPIVWLRKA